MVTTTTVDGALKSNGLQNTDQLMDRHLKMSPIQSRLLSLRGLLGRIAQEHISNFTFHEVAMRHAEEIYTLEFRDFNVKVQIRTFHMAHPPERRVSTPETALSISRVLRGIEASSPSKGDEMARSQYYMVRDIVQKLFIMASSETQYQTSIEADYWSIFFNDPKASTQAEIEVERR